MENTNLTAQNTIDLKRLFDELIKRWYIIVSITGVVLLMTAIYSFFIATPMYNSSAKMLIINRQSDNMSTSDLSISTYLTRDFQNLIEDRVVLDAVAEELDNKYSYGQIESFISIVIPEDTRIIELNVKSPNAEDSKTIADSICRISQEKFVEMMGIDRITIIRNGDIATGPSSPNIKENMILGLFAGLVFSVFIVSAFWLLNNKICYVNDVEKYLNLSVLATIPYHQSKTKLK